MLRQFQLETKFRSPKNPRASVVDLSGVKLTRFLAQSSSNGDSKPKFFVVANQKSAAVPELSADDSSVNFTGTEFFLDGDLIDDLEVGETRLLDASLTLFTLSGVLSDGSEFSSPINRRFADNLQISITRVDSISEPVLLGDVDLNGSVNFSDISPFILVLVSGAFQAEADCDENGVVNFLDISPFIAILSSL